MFETTNEIPFMELKHLATTQPFFSARRNTQNKGGTSEALTISVSRSDHLRPRKTNDESSDPISGSVDSMVKIEKKHFWAKEYGMKTCVADCCLMLYDVVCHHLPLVGSGGDPLYIELYQTTIQGLPGLVASIRYNSISCSYHTCRPYPILLGRNRCRITLFGL